MGKTIFVKNLLKCEKCRWYGKLGCYSMDCPNKSHMIDNSEKNKLLYEECLVTEHKTEGT